MVTNLCKNDIMLAIVHEKYRYIFQKGDADRKIGKKALRKYRSIVDCATKLPDYKQILLNTTGGMSSQKMTSLAKRNENMIHLKQTTCRLPHSGAAQTRLGAPLKYPAPAAFAEQMIKERYDCGDPATFQEVMMALTCKFKTRTDHKGFDKVLSNAKNIHTWLKRLLFRIQFSSQKGTAISQKVPTNWLEVARATSAYIRSKAIELKIDNMLAADETFITFYYSTKMLVPTGTKRVGTSVSVENEKKGITVVVTANLLSSQLLPAFIVDTGMFGADLMKAWSTYSRSKVVFNSSHWMTQYVFVIYLSWLVKMNPSSRTMLVVDKSTTHMGDIVDEWLRENHESPGAGKVFLMFINEGMTSVQQVADIGINFILKKAIKGRYQVFRDSAVEGLTISELAGSVITVPREDLFEMVETTIDDINTENRRRRWIAATFAQCGQDPWSADMSAFEAHLAKIGSTPSYGNLTALALCNSKLDLR